MSYDRTSQIVALQQEFQSAKLSLRLGIEGRQCTTYAIGGPFVALFEPQSEGELQSGLALLARAQISYRILGNGSNLLISDEGVSDVVIRLGRGFRTIVAGDKEGEVIVGGAYSLMTLSREMSERGLSGLEFAGGIPASLGGAIRMNAGAHGGEIAERVISIALMLPDGTLSKVTPNECVFSYRHSVLPLGAIVIGATFQFALGDPAHIAQTRTHYLERRKKTQPLASPSAGSVFKNPPGSESAGALIESVGLKGAREGGAEISSLHANWIINPQKRATELEVTALIERCKREVRAHRGVELIQEVIRW